MSDLLIAKVSCSASDRGTQIELAVGAPPNIPSPLTAYDEMESESSLGFPVPELLKAIYRKIGNGGFGPGYGLLGLNGGAKDDQGHNAVELYHLYSSSDPEHSGWRWPEGLLPICHWGCAIYSCVDCKTDGFPIIVFDPNVHEKSWTPCFIRTERTLESWFTAWSEGTNLWNETYGEPET